MARLGKYRLLVAVVVASAALDQSSKALASVLLEPGRSVPIVGEVVDLRLRHNPGVGWSLGAGLPPRAREIAFPLVGTLVALALLWAYRRVDAERTRARIGLALLLGGGVGNGIDRLRLGRVIDFVGLHVRLDRLEMSGTCNLADLVMAAGLIVLGLDALSAHRRGALANGGGA